MESQDVVSEKEDEAAFVNADHLQSEWQQVSVAYVGQQCSLAWIHF